MRAPGHSWTPERLEALRNADIDRTVQDLGAVAALERFDDALAVTVRQAAAARAKGMGRTADGLDAAAAYLRKSVAVLVERYA